MKILSVLLPVLLIACGSFGEPPPVLDEGPDAGFDPDPDPDPDPIIDGDGDGVADGLDNCPRLANAGQADGDGDEVGDLCDCEPATASVAAEIVLDDSLDTSRSQIAPAIGFAPGSWTFSNGGYSQDRLDDDAADAAFATLPERLGDVRVRVTAASTEIQSFDDDDLRQLFVVARADATATSYSALACGAEIVEALADTRKTSVIAQSGNATAPTTTPRQRTDREALSEGQEFEILMDLRAGAMTCAVTIDGVTTTAAITDAPASIGAVGFFTRETRATFKNLQICAYR